MKKFRLGDVVTDHNGCAGRIVATDYRDANNFGVNLYRTGYVQRTTDQLTLGAILDEVQS